MFQNLYCTDWYNLYIYVCMYIYVYILIQVTTSKNNPHILYWLKYQIVNPILKISANIYKLSSNYIQCNFDNVTVSLEKFYWMYLELFVAFYFILPCKV